jgi:Transposase IS4
LYKHTRILPIPVAIDEYNRFMGGVDIANQLRAGFSTHQRGVKFWHPLFYWLLDSTIINAFRLSENQRKSRILQLGDEKDKKDQHQAFRNALVKALLEDPSPKPPVQVYITKKKTDLPQIRFTRPIGIHQLVRGNRTSCLFCRWTRQHKRASNWKVITKSCNVPKTQIQCSHCSVPLCRECFFPFHYFVV